VGPARYVAAYRHIVNVMRTAGADNLQWIWHVNWDDCPESHRNRLENYFPGENYCTWIAVSAYGPLTPRTVEGLEDFRYEIDHVYPRLTKLAPKKPIIVAEFGCDIHHPKVTASAWAHAALCELFSRRWPAIIGFCWWNESWENDDVVENNSDLFILHDSTLKTVFRDDLQSHRDRIQETPLVQRKH
jgi:beta-mannanase